MSNHIRERPRLSDTQLEKVPALTPDAEPSMII
jgi:hypothetical protein